MISVALNTLDSLLGPKACTEPPQLSCDLPDVVIPVTPSWRNM